MGLMRDLLETPVDSIDAPIPIPKGEWVFQIEDTGFTAEKKDQPGVVWFSLKPVEPTDEVDPAEAEEYMQDVEDRANQFHRLKVRNKDDFHRVRTFLQDIGAPTNDRNIKQALKEAAGLYVIASVGHEPNEENPDRPWVNLKGFQGVQVTEESEEPTKEEAKPSEAAKVIAKASKAETKRKASATKVDEEPADEDQMDAEPADLSKDMDDELPF